MIMYATVICFFIASVYVHRWILSFRHHQRSRRRILNFLRRSRHLSVMNRYHNFLLVEYRMVWKLNSDCLSVFPSNGSLDGKLHLSLYVFWKFHWNFACLGMFHLFCLSPVFCLHRDSHFS